MDKSYLVAVVPPGVPYLIYGEAHPQWRGLGDMDLFCETCETTTGQLVCFHLRHHRFPRAGTLPCSFTCLHCGTVTHEEKEI